MPHFLRSPDDSRRSWAGCDLYPQCQWENWFVTERDATVAEVLHILKHHPEYYKQKTGRDPEERLHAYAEPLRLFKRYI